jgi:hypothetical protein
VVPGAVTDIWRKKLFPISVMNWNTIPRLSNPGSGCTSAGVHGFIPKMINLSSTGISLAVAKRNDFDPAANRSSKLRPVTLLTTKAWFIKLHTLIK